MPFAFPPVTLRGASLVVGAVTALALGPVGAKAQPAAITIDDTNVFPESLDSGPDGTLYIGSIQKGAIYRAAPGEKTATVWIKAAATPQTVLGVVADAAHDRLWVCASDPAGPAPAAGAPAAPPPPTMLLAYDLKSGDAKGRYPFTGSGRCNDIVVDRDGNVFATDTPNGRIVKLTPNGAMSNWVQDARLAGIDGIAFGPNNTIVVNTVTTNLLFSIAMRPDGTAGAVTQLELSQPLNGPDGMRPGKDGKLLIAENRVGRISQVAISGNKATIEVLKEGYVTPTAMTLAGNTIWVLEAKFALRNDPSKNPNPFTVQPLPVR